MPTILTIALKAVGAVAEFSLDGFTFDNVSFSVSSQETTPRGITFNSDGTKMFVIGNNSDSVHQYTLSTGFDLSTASFDNESFSVSSQETTPSSVAFSPDGTKMFIAGTGSDSIHQYTLSTGFDLSTASFDNESFDVSSQDTIVRGITFNSDGTKMFMFGINSISIHQYTLSTGFDLSTASFDNESFSVSSQDTSPTAVVFNPDGTKMFIAGTGSDSVHQYTLSTGFDLSTASFDNESFDVSGQDGSPQGLAFSDDGTKMFIVGLHTDSVHQYSK